MDADRILQWYELLFGWLDRDVVLIVFLGNALGTLKLAVFLFIARPRAVTVWVLTAGITLAISALIWYNIGAFHGEARFPLWGSLLAWAVGCMAIFAAQQALSEIEALHYGLHRPMAKITAGMMAYVAALFALSLEQVLPQTTWFGAAWRLVAPICMIMMLTCCTLGVVDAVLARIARLRKR